MTRSNDGFDILLRALPPGLYRYAMGQCRHPEQAADPMQQALPRVRRAQRSRPDTKMARVWLYCILRNEYARLYARRRPEVSEPANLPPVAAPTFDTNSEAFALHRALQALHLQYREPLLLQIVDGFSSGDIAQLQDLNLNTLLTRLFRARKTLRTMLVSPEAQLEGKFHELS